MAKTRRYAVASVKNTLRGRDMIDTQEWSRQEIGAVLDLAFDLKRQRAQGIPHPILRDKVLAMLFFYSSTRTRASFEAGMAQLGGHAQFIESRTTQIAHGDTDRRDPRPVQRRDRHPPRGLGTGESVHP